MVEYFQGCNRIRLHDKIKPIMQSACKHYVKVKRFQLEALDLHDYIVTYIFCLMGKFTVVISFYWIIVLIQIFKGHKFYCFLRITYMTQKNLVLQIDSACIIIHKIRPTIHCKNDEFTASTKYVYTIVESSI